MFPEDFCNTTKRFWKRFKLLCIFQSFNREREVRQLAKYVSLRLNYRRYYTNVAEVYYLLIPVNVYVNLFKKTLRFHYRVEVPRIILSKIDNFEN